MGERSIVRPPVRLSQYAGSVMTYVLGSGLFMHQRFVGSREFHGDTRRHSAFSSVFF